jgi:hypothetical protein
MPLLKHTMIYEHFLHNFLSIIYIYKYSTECQVLEELDGRAVSALSVWTWKLSNDDRGQSLDGWPKFIIRASEGRLGCCSRLHLQSLASTPVSRRADVRQVAGGKNKCRIFITTWWKHVVPTPLSGIRVGRRITECRERVCIELYYSNDVCVWRVFCVETSASSGRTKRFFHIKSIRLTRSSTLNTSLQRLIRCKLVLGPQYCLGR